MYIFFRFTCVYSLIFVTFADDNRTKTMTNKWIRRRLNAWGYGVQSPNDFYFVQHVLREKLPYYAYPILAELQQRFGNGLPHDSLAANRLLFRLANYVHPDSIIEVGAGTSIAAMAMACPTARCMAITADPAHCHALQQLLAKHPKATVENSDEMAVFRQFLSGNNAIGILHIAATAHYQEIVEEALSHVSDRTLIIISGLQDSPDKQAWWKELQESPRTGVSYDLGTMGILFFDKARYKATYWIKLKR